MSPYIKSTTQLPELTFKSITLGLLLTAVLAGANAYLGLFAGMTVSASIPAAVISMAVLSLFRRHNILENNAVQTAASAGEALAAGVIFTIPALVLMGYWEEFDYWQTTSIAAAGGILGVCFTVPLRRALIVQQKLRFPEGLATAQVLRTGAEGGKSVRFLVWAALVGALFKFLDSGGKLWHGVLDKAAIVGKKTYLYFGMNLSPALMAVGYIVGLQIAVLVFIGGAISWWIAMPIYIWMHGAPAGVDAVDLGYQIWSTKIRYLGVGAMVVGGLWALISMRSSLAEAVRQGLSAVKSKKIESTARTERDTPLKWVLFMIVGLILPIFLLYLREIGIVEVSLFMAVMMTVAGFLFSAVAGYMAGLVGSSNNPISGVTIATILFSALMLALLLGTNTAKGPAAAILIGAVVCCSAAIAGDNMQDLKAGHELGATPWKQQLMQVVGVVGGAAIIAPVLNLLHTAYRIGPKTPAFPDALTAPQASLMKSVAQGVFGGSLPWGLISIGAAIGVTIIIVDEILKAKKSSFRAPVLAVAIGIYLPFELGSSILLGGLIAWLAAGYKGRKKAKDERAGLLIASGLIAGEALVGILLAIPIALSGKGNYFAMVEKTPGAWPGMIGLGLICLWLYKSSRGTRAIH